MNDNTFALLLVTAEDIAKAFTKYDRLRAQVTNVTRDVEAANSVFDKALASEGRLDVTIPQRRVLDALALMADCEKRVQKAQEELIEACACVVAEGYFDGVKK